MSGKAIYYILTTWLFCISPISSILFAFLYLLFKKNVRTREYFYFVFLFSVLLGILNAGKIPENDLIMYKFWYEDVKNYDFVGYLFYHGREPLFFLYNYLIYYLTFGSFEAYLVIHTAICYSIMGYAILRMHKVFKFPKEYLVTSILVLFLFPHLFSLSVHLMRQFLAASILLLFTIDVAFYNKKRIVLFLAALMVHTTAFLFAILYLIKKIKSTKLVMLFVILTFGAFTILVFKFSNSFLDGSSETNMINYGITRLQNRDESIELQKLSILHFALFIFIVLGFYQLRQNWKMKNRGVLLYLSTLLLTFISINYNDTELALRISFYMFFLFPISLYFFLKSSKVIKYNKDKRVIASLFLIVFSSWFIYKLYNGVWTYQHIERVLFTGFW